MRFRFAGFYNWGPNEPLLDRVKTYAVTTVGEILNDKNVE